MLIGVVERETFLSLLQTTQGIVERKSLNPILSAVIVAITPPKHVEVQATNMEESVRVMAEGNFKHEARIAVPLAKLIDFVRELPPGEVLIERGEEGNLLSIGAGKVSASLPILPDHEFPLLPTPPQSTFQLNREALQDALHKTFFSIATDSVSTSLRGLLLRKENGKLSFVSTDGHRLSLLEKEQLKLPGGELDLLIPRKGIQEIRRVLEKTTEETVNFGFSQNHLYLSSSSVELFIRLLDAKYPNYEKVIPQEFSTKLKLHRDSLLKAVKRVSLFSSERVRGVRIDVQDDGVIVSSLAGVEEPFAGAAREVIEFLELEGKNVRLGLNARYVMEMLAILEGEVVVIEMGDPLWPVKFTSPSLEGYLHILMPLHLEEVES